MVDLVGTYQVFLSFRGIDTRNGFTDHLYNNLTAAGIHTFRDDNELRLGEEIDSELLKAIKDSKISIPIFSKNYADSKWCLRELAHMVDCRETDGQKIYPIFYNVVANEVQHCKRGSYNKAFVKYENDPSLDQKTVEKWKKALAIVGGLKGYELQKEANGLEGALVKMVIQKILSELKKSSMHLPETLVGIKDHIEKLKGLLDIESNGVRIIGILGMSGLGKTTIAKAIYNELNELFESHCFLEDVRGEAQRHNGLLNLQKQLLSKVLNRLTRTIDHVDEGTNAIKDAIRGKKVFLVFDNVNDRVQIQKLAVDHNWYGPGSRVIITTTNEEVLLEIKAACDVEGRSDIYKCYKPEPMGKKDSLKLFSKCAFKRDSPQEGYVELSKDLVSNAGGLPLVLETLGSSLFIESDKVCWEEKLKKLKKIPPQKILERLRISYETLDIHEKELFLDIACFFVGKHISVPVYMWDSCGFHTSEGIRTLVRKSLITVTEDEILKMHDSLQELGRQISKGYFTDLGEHRSRIWDHEEALEMLERRQGLKNVEALCLKFDRPPNISSTFSSGGHLTNWWSRQVSAMKWYQIKDRFPRLEGKDFAKLRKLRFLRVAFADLVGDFKGHHSQLRWIEWQGCSGNSAPINLSLKNLVVLELKECTMWDNWKWWSQIKNAKKLKVLNISGCLNLASIPPLSYLSSLEILNLNNCQRLSRIDKLGQLVSLIQLRLEFCINLEWLPDLSRMRKLRSLHISNCVVLHTIGDLKELESLEYLVIDRCYCLTRLPDLSNLQKLTTFSAKNCVGLTEVQGLHRLRLLEHFNMSGCLSLKTFPDLLNFGKIIKLNTSGWEVTYVDGLGNLESLEYLTLQRNRHLKGLPGLWKLRNLKELVILSCEELFDIQGLCGLVSLEVFRLGNCKSIKSITGLANLKKLNIVHITACEELTKISKLNGMKSLEILEISFCRNLERLPDLSNLWKLKVLTITSLDKVVDIPGVERLKSLRKLSVTYMEQIKRLPVLPNFGMLKELYLTYCRNLCDVESLTAVQSLERLDLSFCKVLGEMLDFSNLKNLKDMNVFGCVKLDEIRVHEELVSLTWSKFRGCPGKEHILHQSLF